MVTSEEELALAYLLDPCFQIVNSAGKPLTDGWLEVYYHGTRTKYYCYSDWNGSLHPFKIPLDSLGANIVLASPDFAYDVYVYNKFGSLIMSRYNVTPGQGGGGSGGIPSQYEAEHWLGQYGATQPLEGNERGQTLALPSNPDYQGDFIDHIDYGTIAGGDTNQYPKYMYLKPGLYLVNCVIRFQQQSGTEVNRLDELLVYTGNGNANEDVAWIQDETGPNTTGDRHCLKLTFIRKVLDEGETSTVDCSNILYFAPAPQVNWSDAYIQTLQVVKMNSAVGGGGHASMLKPGPGISIDEEAVISVTGMQPVSGMNEYVTVNYFGDTITNVTGDIYNIVSGVTGDINDVSEVVNNVTGDINEITNIVNNVTGDISEVTNIVNGVTGDIEQLNTDIQAVSAALPDAQIQSDWNEADPDSKAYIQNKPDLSVYATHNEVTGDIQNVTSIIEQQIINVTGDVASVSADAQVQSDWTEDDTSDLAYIKNKPAEVVLAAGDNIVLTRSEGVLTISASGGDLSPYATVSGVAAVSSIIENEVQAVSGQVAAVSAAVADIPEQVNADWNATEGKAEILNKPDLTVYATHSEVNGVSSVLQNEINVVTGDIQNITTVVNNVTGDIQNLQTTVNNVTGDVASLETTVNNVTGDIQNIQGDVTNVTNVVNGVTGDVQNVSGAVNTVSGQVAAVSALIPDAQVQSDWTEADSASKAYIKHKPTATQIVAGNNVSIQEVNGQVVISASGGGGGSTYTGASGVTVDNENDVISLESPVDVVAGPGIVIDNPDGNTMRISAENNLGMYDGASGVVVDHTNKQIYADETILWDGNNSPSSSITLSEPISNFNLIRLTFRAWERHICVFIDPINTGDKAFQCAISWCESNGLVNLGYVYTYDNSTKTITKGSFFGYMISGTTITAMSASTNNVGIVKVVGINRKSV